MTPPIWPLRIRARKYLPGTVPCIGTNMSWPTIWPIDGSATVRAPAPLAASATPAAKPATPIRRDLFTVPSPSMVPAAPDHGQCVDPSQPYQLSGAISALILARSRLRKVRRV
jgi:hypothetical protein